MKNEFNKKKYLIVGIGELLWDILPSGKKQIGGAPANFAYHTNNFEAKGAVISAIGNDEDGRKILNNLKQKGIITEHIQVNKKVKTGTVNIKYDNDKVPIFTINENTAWDNIKVIEETKKFIKKADAICYGTLSQRNRISQKAIISYIKSTKPECLKIYDINIRQNYYNKNIIQNTLELSDILKISEEELSTVAEVLGLSGTNKDILKNILTKYSLKVIAYTKGRNGANLIFKNNTIKHKGYKTKVVDTVGCGDAFTAILALGILKQNSYENILKDANKIASYVASKKGAMPDMKNNF